MPGGGTLSLKAENITIDAASAHEHQGVARGAFVTFQVEDTGVGIPPDVLARIWEPFFTTKGIDKGTGLGLSTVRGIVESHSGVITVQTTPGQGTRFRVYLPALDQAQESDSASTPAPEMPRGNGEWILVVDDEASIRNMCATMLSRQGYRVLTAADGAEAIALFAPRSKDIQLVITDLSMPNVDGAGLARAIRRLNTRVKIIAISGLADSQRGEAPAQNFTNFFLHKPFRSEALLTMTHDLLSARPTN
jgi:CheY-like chemotaxis protein